MRDSEVGWERRRFYLYIFRIQGIGRISRGNAENAVPVSKGRWRLDGTKSRFTFDREYLGNFLPILTAIDVFQQVAKNNNP